MLKDIGYDFLDYHAHLRQGTWWIDLQKFYYSLSFIFPCDAVLFELVPVKLPYDIRKAVGKLIRTPNER